MREWEERAPEKKGMRQLKRKNLFSFHYRERSCTTEGKHVAERMQ